MIRGALVLLCLLAGPARADLTGTWCADQTIQIDATGVGFNEHTICNWDAPPAATGGVALTLTCRNVYPGADLGDPVVEQRVTAPTYLTIVRLSGDRLAAQFGDAPRGELYEKCD